MKDPVRPVGMKDLEVCSQVMKYFENKPSELLQGHSFSLNDVKRLSKYSVIILKNNLRYSAFLLVVCQVKTLRAVYVIQ